jgi:hypothetical protein
MVLGFFAASDVRKHTTNNNKFHSWIRDLTCDGIEPNPGWSCKECGKKTRNDSSSTPLTKCPKCGATRSAKSLAICNGFVNGPTSYDPATGKILPSYHHKHYVENIEHHKFVVKQYQKTVNYKQNRRKTYLKVKTEYIKLRNKLADENGKCMISYQPSRRHRSPSS